MLLMCCMVLFKRVCYYSVRYCAITAIIKGRHDEAGIKCYFRTFDIMRYNAR